MHVQCLHNTRPNAPLPTAAASRLKAHSLVKLSRPQTKPSAAPGRWRLTRGTACWGANWWRPKGGMAAEVTYHTSKNTVSQAQTPQPELITCRNSCCDACARLREAVAKVAFELLRRPPFFLAQRFALRQCCSCCTTTLSRDIAYTATAAAAATAAAVAAIAAAEASPL